MATRGWEHATPTDMAQAEVVAVTGWDRGRRGVNEARDSSSRSCSSR